MTLKQRIYFIGLL